MSIASLKPRQRKLFASPTVFHHPKKEQQNDDLKKQKPLHIRNPNYHSSKDCLFAAVLFVVSLPVRFKNISNPDQVVFNEVLFGQDASYYITQRFFFDVQPPLAKMLIALVAWIAGYDGQFEFKESGSSEYPSAFPYATVRGFGALLGCLVVPLAYLTIRNAGHSIFAAAITALAICFENGFITSDRLILLDSYLLFFTASSVYAYTTFYRQSAFGRSWWVWLLLTGVSLGCALSSKWVGLFTITTIGLSASKQLWEILGDIKVTKRQYCVHLCARLTCLCIIPIVIYLATFYAHLSLLSESGPGDNYMEIETQNELKGIDPVDTPVPVAYGSLITMRHLETTGGYLHSHAANYVEGSGQQQVTLYPYKDENNWWRILKADVDKKNTPDLLGSDNTTFLEFIRHGDIIRLEHVASAPRKLHSHNVPAPVTDTDYHFEVSGYGFENYTGDSNDFWRVQIDNNTAHPDAGRYLEARRSIFRLEHPNQDCHLYSSFERLPEWGYGQQEVSCIQEGLKAKVLWIIDETENPLLPPGVAIEHEHRPGFISKLMRLHHAMWSFNVDLTETYPFQTRPHVWPLLLSGVNYWVSETAQIILLGNPAVFWASTVAVLAFGIMFTFFRLRDQRGFRDNFNGKRAYYETSAGFFALGWALHYIPFYYMDSQLFLNYYMPALYLAVLTLGVGLDLILSRFHCAAKIMFAVAASASIIYAYRIYAPITYGEPWSVAACEKATLLDSWDLNCARHDVGGLHRVRLNRAGDFDAPVVEPPFPAEQHLKLEPEDGIIYADDNGYRIAPGNVHGEVHMNEDDDESEDEYDDNDDDYEEDIDSPTDPPVYAEPEPEFVDGKEVFGDDDDDDEYPKTLYGVDPMADEDEEADPFPLKIRDIPSTIYV
ncbi:Dolichyl-phosphate-mannose-protein mannosyltransferase-domain-containing protein [Parasitella parasitica]|nr:Dolichyl-phosphate-mannose-protein mannosyltransferase-domain-containing protein [Parasitella parasitica]